MPTPSPVASSPTTSRFGPLVLGALAVALLLSGCVNGNNYPKTYAAAYCGALFACVDESEIENWTAYDDEKECREDFQADLEDTSTYDQWEEGDRTFDSDAANACINEADQIRDDSDCGTMNFLEFFVDSGTDECSEVYPDADSEED